MSIPTAIGIPSCRGGGRREHSGITSRLMTAMGSSTEFHEALAALGLRTTPRSRQDLARWVAARHPASQPWSAVQTAAYRRVWEELESGCEADVPMAA
ncbi:hypothetical protein BBFGKLBO_03005 [Synechococcus sp. CBW1107]|nr:hypothetical protein BBFGKLBO_03005 [Synechococcus sp. CBW1107]